ncbi:MAG: PDDEXK nuclease domain-containing protein [Caldilineaceae bacterium]|jgi:predicted nuclease of restriction endonuclease-like (RecB) superfamily
MTDNQLSPVPADYIHLLQRLTEQIRRAQIRAALSVNQELVLLYWQIGQEILLRQEEQGWGAKIIDQLAHDLRREFPTMKGFSARNLKYMRAFAKAWPDLPIVQQVAAQLPWFHNCVLLDKLAEPAERLWYARQAIQHGWSRNILIHQIQSRLHLRQGQAQTNFDRTLPAPQSELAQQILKDPYNFDFLDLGEEAHERDLERALLNHLQQFLLELGVGFAFVGSQVHLAVGERNFYLDMLFYHLKLRCFAVIDLKIGEFEPEHAGKMNFYLSAVDAQLRHPDDQPSIGLILCRNKDRVVAEYALRDVNKPIGISAYELTQALPEEYQGSLPTIEELEAELSASSIDNEK